MHNPPPCSAAPGEHTDHRTHGSHLPVGMGGTSCGVLACASETIGSAAEPVLGVASIEVCRVPGRMRKWLKNTGRATQLLTRLSESGQQDATRDKVAIAMCIAPLYNVNETALPRSKQSPAI